MYSGHISRYGVLFLAVPLSVYSRCQGDVATVSLDGRLFRGTYGEMVAQFFTNPVNGAIGYTLLFSVAQQLSSLWLRQFFPTLKKGYRFLLSLIVPLVLWRLALVPTMPLTLTMAVLLVMGAGCGLMAISQKPSSKKRLWALLPAIAVMYWLAGPAVILLVLCQVRWMPLTATLFAACLIGSS